MAFEDSRSGPQLYLDTLTSSTAPPFIRFLYAGNYVPLFSDCNVYEDVPTSVLFHCQMYRLGDIYDLEELKTQAYVNILRQCEFGCSSPDQPIDLCAAIRYFYQYMPAQERIINTILDYCVTCFLTHRLGEDKEFKELAFELRPFHQALCMNSRERGYEHEAAAAIIQLPFKPYVPETYASREDAAAQRFDDVFHFHANDELDAASPKKRKRPTAEAGPSVDLAFRPLASGEAEERVPQRLSEDNVYTSKSKRRASMIEEESKIPVSVPVPPFEEEERTLPVRLRVVNGSPEPDDHEEPAGSAAEEAHSTVPEPTLDSDFEFVAGPAAVEALSDSDSDDPSMVKVTHEDAKPFRPANLSSAGPATARPLGLADLDVGPARPTKMAESDPDSDWELM